jgi:hypothetical protein
MEFSTGFVIQFVVIFIGFQFLGIYLCRGTWRNQLKTPLQIGLALLLAGHIVSNRLSTNQMIFVVLAFIVITLFSTRKLKYFTPSEVRGGHNFFSLLVGAGLFALVAQLHSVLVGVPVFQLVK